MRKRISYRDAAHGRATEGPIGPRAVGDGDEPIPHAGSHTSKPGNRGGAHEGHPQNALHADGAGTGTDGASSGSKGGEAPGAFTVNSASASAKQPLKTAPNHRRHAAPPRGGAGSNRFTGGRRELGNFLAKIARGGAR